MAKTYKGKSLRKGGGGQFQREVDAILRGNPSMSEEEAKAIAAKHGREKYGKTEFQHMAVVGKRRAARKGK